MKKSKIFALAASAALLAIAFSCQTVNNVFGKPELSMEKVGIKALDLEGITFNCNYSITNPYPIGISLKSLAADILYNSSEKFTSISSDGGVSIAANGKNSNALDFKVPYTTILNFAKSASGKTSLPFSVNGSAALDLSAVTGLDIQSFSIPFAKDFDVPVFKPSFSVSNVKLKLPTLAALSSSLISSGVGSARATQLATSILSGQQLSPNAFDGIDLNLDVTMDLNVKNSGSAPWNMVIKNCSLMNGSGGRLASISPISGNTISSESASVPMKASVNTLQAGAMIVSILNKKGTNPSVAIESGISFPGLNYAEVPLSYSKEISLTSIGIEK
ncbi:MAG: LEA type 2 family protein [Treponema sp.]|nr:LEA type 2 family protein [Treponema sp.]MCR5622317.1 LEA type 2 family protein [Treponema sp.]